MNLKNAKNHLGTVVKHKAYVYEYGRLLGLSRSQCLKHDLSKFSPVEFLESIKFYTGTSSPIDEAKRVQGYSMAWLNHKGKNKTHWEYWLDKLSEGGEPVRIPRKYAYEIIADYHAAGKAYGQGNYCEGTQYDWWVKKIPHMKFHKETEKFLELYFHEIKVQMNNGAKFEAICKEVADRAWYVATTEIKVVHQGKDYMLIEY